MIIKFEALSAHPWGDIVTAIAHPLGSAWLSRHSPVILCVFCERPSLSPVCYGWRQYIIHYLAAADHPGIVGCAECVTSVKFNLKT